MAIFNLFTIKVSDSRYVFEFSGNKVSSSADWNIL